MGESLLGQVLREAEAAAHQVEGTDEARVLAPAELRQLVVHVSPSPA